MSRFASCWFPALSANLIKINGEGKIVATATPRAMQRITNTAPSGVQRVEAAVAWRSVLSPGGTVRVLHQYDLAETIDLDSTPPPTAPQSYYGPPPDGCGGLVQIAMSTLDSGGNLSMGAPLNAPILAVDATISPDGMWIALAHAGTADPEQGTARTVFTPDGIGALGQVSILDSGDTPATGNPTPCVPPNATIAVRGQATAVAFNPATDAAAVAEGTWLAVQTREPPSLVLLGDASGTKATTIPLGGQSVLDSGHEIFHRDSGTGIACASCHAEGAEDGRVWKFSPIGDRRTQPVNIGLVGTEPFHWDGDAPDLANLMDVVFVKRMGGPHETPERVAALSSWMGGLTPPARIVASDDAEAVRGQALFEAKDVGCSGCHSGPKFTNNQNAVVGTTEPGHSVQVPSLVGVGFRAPYLHDGCAPTLRNRFDPGCGGGDKHGTTSTLSEEQIGDLVAYLRAL